MARLKKQSARPPAGPNAEPEDVPGYRGLQPIGQGGFSVVYRAWQEALDREVALKVVTIGLDDTVRRRFLREVSLTSRLTGHPNVVTVLDTGTTRSGRPYLAMNLHEAGSLADRLDQQGPLPPADVALIGAKIAGALDAAHQVGIVHRDVKPNNILVSRFGEPALADFGVACLLDDRASMTVLGTFTVRHAAPEVVNGSQPSAASDVYSLGSSLYELVCGRPAFEGHGHEVVALMHRILTEEPAELDCPALPGLVGVIRRAMAKHPQDRYISAAALAADLAALARDARVDPAVGSTPGVPAPTSGFVDPPNRTKELPDEGTHAGTGWPRGPGNGQDETSLRAGRDRVAVAAQPTPGRSRFRTAAAALAAAAVLAAAGTAVWLNWPESAESPQATRPAAAARTASPTTSASDHPPRTAKPKTSKRPTAAPPADQQQAPPAARKTSAPAKRDTPAPAPPAAPKPPAQPQPKSASVCTPDGCAGRATFDSTGEHVLVCDRTDDGYGVVARYTRSDRSGQGNAWDREGTGKCTDHNMNMPEGAKITFQVCLEDEGTRVFGCSEFVTGTA